MLSSHNPLLHLPDRRAYRFATSSALPAALLSFANQGRLNQGKTRRVAAGGPSGLWRTALNSFCPKPNRHSNPVWAKCEPGLERAASITSEIGKSASQTLRKF